MGNEEHCPGKKWDPSVVGRFRSNRAFSPCRIHGYRSDGRFRGRKDDDRHAAGQGPWLGLCGRRRFSSGGQRGEDGAGGAALGCRPVALAARDSCVHTGAPGQRRSGRGYVFCPQKLFGGWIFRRDTAGDVHERDPNAPCSGATGRVQNPFCTRSAKSQAIDSPPNSFSRPPIAMSYFRRATTCGSCISGAHTS